MKDLLGGQGDDFKGNFNFSTLLEKNEKKASKGPISSLLQSTTQSIVNEGIEDNSNKDNLIQKIEDLERRFETKEVSEKFERLESLLQSVIINQSSQKQLELNKEPTPEKNSSKNLILASGLLSAALIISALLVTPAKVKTPELIKPVAAVEKVSVKFHTPTKYLNLRSIASTKGQKLLVVAPNTRVEILKTDGEWVQIRFDNYLKGTTHTGWIYDLKNLKSI